MRTPQSAPLAAATMAAAVLLAGAARRPAPQWPQYVLTDREGFVLQEAQLVAPPPVASADWSSDGRYVLAVRQEEQPRLRGGEPPSPTAVTLVAWSRRTGRSQEIWKRSSALQHVDRLGWLPRTHAALLQLGWVTLPPANPEIRNTLFWVDAARGQVRAIGELQQELLLISPSQPLAVLFGQGQASLRVIRADGNVGPTLRLKSDPGTPQWSADGRTLYLQNWEKPADRGLPPTMKWQAIDLQTGALTPLASAPAVYQEPERSAPIQVRSAATTLKEANTAQRVLPLWLESTAKSEQPRALLSADSDGGSLAPDLSAALYLSEGAAWAVPLTRLSRQQVLTQIREAQREATLSNAKQIGLAFAMYAQDYDEVFPPAGDGVIGQLSPYVKSGDVFSVFTPAGDRSPGFVYLLNAVSLGSIPEPAAQELGYLPGPGGRAVIFVDGHVEWRSDQPETPRARPVPGAAHFR